MTTPTEITTPPPSPPPPGAAPANNTKAVIALVLGILSLVCCGFFSGIPAIFVGRSELKDIDEGRSIEANRTLAKLGFILGLIGTILSCLGALAYIAIIAIAIISGNRNVPSTF
jgi:uncharacterized protein DUF4190